MLFLEYERSEIFIHEGFNIKALIYYLLDMLLLLLGKVLHSFHNFLGVLEVVLFYLVNCCVHVEKKHQNLSLSIILWMKTLLEKSYELVETLGQACRDVVCFDFCHIDELV